MDATLHDMYYNSLFLVRESWIRFGRQSRIMLKASKIPGSYLLDWMIPDEEMDVLIQSPADMGCMDDPKWLPVFVFSYAYSLYYGENSFSGTSISGRMSNVMMDWQKIVRRIVYARANRIEIPDVLVFDFDDYPRILSDLGILKSFTDSDQTAS